MKTTLRLVSLLSCIFIFSTMTCVADVYRWTDDNGKVVFGDTPPKNKTATAVLIENTGDSGAQFATPGQIKSLEQNAEIRRRQKQAANRSKVDSHCRGYVSQLNKIEIFLQHTPTDLDRQKANDLRKLIKIECDNNVLSQKHDDWQCKRYRTDLTKAEIFLEHTPTDRDKQKVKDLRKQIALECN